MWKFIKSKRWWLFLFVFLLLPLMGHAANISLALSVDKTEVGLNEYFTLTVTSSVEGRIGRIPEPTLPHLNDFKIVGKSTSQSTQINIINGKMNQVKTFEYDYTIMPKKMGKFTIPPASLKYKGNVYKSEPVEITVVKEVKRQSPPPQSQSDIFQGNRQNIPIEGNIFIRAIPSRTKVYQGQEVDITYKLYTRFSILNFQYTKIPSYKNCWVEKLFEAKHLSTKEEVYNGKRFSSAVLSKIALFPMNPGSLRIEKVEASCEIQTGDIFDIFGGTKTITLTSNPVIINVLPLPSNKPADFSGGIGDFTLSVKNKKDTLKIGETGEIDVIIQGKGNLKFLSPPKVSFLEDFNTYEPEVENKIEMQGGMHGKKICKYLFVPQSEGEYTISPIDVVFFSPTTKKYYKLSSTPIKIFVRKSPISGTGNTNITYKTQYNKDIHYIKQDIEALKNIAPASPIFIVILYIIGTLIMPVLFAYKRHTELLEKDRAYARRHRVKKEVRKRLKDMTRYLREGKEEEFFGAVNHTILKFTGDRYNLETYGMKSDEIKESLKGKGVDEKYVDKIIKVLRVCDMVRYMPGSKKTDMNAIYQEVKEILNALS